MSDLAATNCGGGCNGVGGGNSCLWLILILIFCGGNGGGCNNVLGGNEGCGCNLIWILLLLCFCGGNNGSFC